MSQSRAIFGMDVFELARHDHARFVAENPRQLVRAGDLTRVEVDFEAAKLADACAAARRRRSTSMRLRSWVFGVGQQHRNRIATLGLHVHLAGPRMTGRQ